MPMIAITRGEKFGDEEELSSGNSREGGGGIVM
jgi:hypothetical protein